ncbi:MAG TPA: sigma 54-interacting transcriptional regulator [Polyangia bacterium]
MTVDVGWQDLLDLHVVRKLRHIVRRRFGVELGFASLMGEPVEGAADTAPCARAAILALGASKITARYQCPAHARAEVAAPIVLDESLHGCVFAALEPGRPDGEEFLIELLELTAEEMVAFAGEIGRRERRQKEGEREYASRYSYDGIIGRSRPVQEMVRLLDKVIDSDSTVLVHGENGTGKELIAKAIHYNSARVGQRFVVQNCSAFNDNLLDSELFGHKRGAFTGAIADKQGLFEVAHRGTFFLDEIADMSPALQVKVLRVLQEGTFTPVGDTQSREVDVRIIAATNRDLKKMVERGEFREDLYYRVNVISLTVPPLRERRDDVPLLVDHFLRRNAKGRRLKVKRLGQGCLDRMMEYAWPGNIRELENEIERLVVLAGDDKVIGEELLSPRIRQSSGPADDASATRPPASLTQAVDQLERSMIYEVLKRTHWNKTQAAKELRISRRNLIRKVNKYKLEKRRVT